MNAAVRTDCTQNKSAIDVETLSMSDIELSEYCRAKSLFLKQVKQGPEISILGHSEPC
jgi:hypothetical protein